jgi:hypothetical protein
MIVRLAAAMAVCGHCGCGTLSQARAPKPRDNMSREMKAKLREEYYGLGGAENKVRGLHISRLIFRPVGCTCLPRTN